MALPIGLVTFVFTDIEGSTRLFRRLGDEYAAMLERHRELLREAWAAHGGHEVKTDGDAFFVAFDDPSNAIAAAVAGQKAIAAEAWPQGIAVLVRIGIHSGLAVPRSGDYIAYSVHQAARLVGAAHGGQVLVSEETVRAVGDRGDLRSLGRFRVRDFEDPVELFAVDLPGVPSSLQKPRATPAMGHNLSQPSTPFIARQLDLDGVAQLLEPGSMTSIVGPGGSGKSRLAVEMGLRVAPDWADGVWLVEMAPLGPGLPLAGAVAEAVGIGVGGRDPLDAVLGDFADATALLILDNCEHVIDAASELATTLLARLKSVALVTTSREPLGIAGERIWRLDSMGEGAPELFLARARDAGWSSTPSSEELDAVTRICERLDGNALAIELAAARAATVGIAALETSLDDSFRILTSRRRDLEPRQRSMTALLDWSYDILDPSERAALRRLSLFSGSFVLDGAQHAAADQDLDGGAVIDSVWALVDKSLLSIDGTSNETRYRLAETVRSYAADRLEESERAAALARLAAWYLHEYGPWTQFDPERLSAARVELDNIRGVVGRLGDGEDAQLLAVTVGYVLDVTGQVIEGIAELDGYVELLQLRTPARALLLAEAAALHYRSGNREYGHLLDRAEAILADVGPEPDWALGKVASMRAAWHSERGEHEAATRVAEQIGGPGDNKVALARRYSFLGIVRGAAGDTIGALEAHRAGLAVEEEIGAPIEIAIGHNNLAEFALQAGDLAESARHQLETLELAAQVGSVVLVAFSLVVAARLAASRDEWVGAVRLHGAAERWLEQSGNALLERDAEISEEMLAEGRARLGAGFNSVREGGRELTIGDAIAEARQELARAR